MKPFPLFKGATRPSTIWGVPTEPFLYAVFGIALLSVAVSLIAWVMLPFVIFVMRAITKKDPRAFRGIGLWIETKVRCSPTVKKFWGACSYSPLTKTNRKKLFKHE